MTKITLKESQLRSLIKEVLKEVRYIDTTVDYNNNGKIRKQDYRQAFNQEPIKNTDVIRVFHGCDLKTAVKFAKEGLSGKQWQPRKYSYEAGMNPIGLFVSTSFNKVKYFANPFNGGKTQNAAVIIEFSARASDLDTPVWNNSYSYFGQGSNPQPFRDKEERDKQKQEYQNLARGAEEDYVRNSDNPAMANSIFNNNEHQALFIGDLNPNMIKRFWVQEFGQGYISKGDYTPMVRSQFLKKYGNEEFYIDRDRYKKVESDKLYLPNEDFTGLEDTARRWAEYEEKNKPKWRKRKIERSGGIEAVNQEILNNLRDCLYKWKDYQLFQSLMWPKQLRQLFGDKEYYEIFDKYGIGDGDR